MDTKERFWRKHLDKQQQSGQSIAGYCREQGLASSSFGHWRRKLRRSSSAEVGTSQEAVTIVSVPLSVPVPDESGTPFSTQGYAPLRLTVAGRFQIDIAGDFSGPVLKKLVTTLEGLA